MTEQCTSIRATIDSNFPPRRIFVLYQPFPTVSEVSARFGGPRANSRSGDEVVEAIHLPVCRPRLSFIANTEITHFALARPCEVPFLTELSTTSKVWHSKHEAICAHSRQNGRTEEWPD